MMAGATGTVTRPGRKWSVREAGSKRDAFYAARLYHHYFGAEYESNSRLPKPLADIVGWVDDDDDYAATAFIAEHEGVRIGASIVEIVSHETVVEELPAGRFDADALAADTNAWLALSAVDPAWRGRGIGLELFRQRLNWARAHGVQLVIGYGWERDGKPSSRPLFEGHGFVPIQRVDDYYARERVACPDCGIWPSDDEDCTCPMTLWARDEYGHTAEREESP